MENLENLSSENSFEELYNAYYFLQVQKNDLPRMENFLDIKEGILNKLNEKLKFSQGKSQKILPVFEQRGIVQSNNNLAILQKGKENLKQYGNHVSGAELNLKKIIEDKIKKQIGSKEFLVNLNLYPDKKILRIERIDYERVQNRTGLSFDNMSLESTFGLYYILHGEIPKAEFFDKKFGWGLRISEFPEVSETLSMIREKHGIKRPRALERTLEQCGRREDNKRLAAKLNYAIVAEGELYSFLRGYSELNFELPIDSAEEQVIGIIEQEKKLGFARFDYDEFKKNTWTRKLIFDEYDSKDFSNEGLKEIFIPKNLRSSIKYSYENGFDVEEVCAHCIEK